MNKPVVRHTNRGWFVKGWRMLTGSVNIHSGAWSPTIGMDGKPLPHDLQLWIGPYENFDDAARAALLKDNYMRLTA